MTKREHFENILTYAHDEDIDFINHELELLARKNSTERKPTAKQVENVGIKAEIVNFMEVDTLYTAADIAKSCPYCVENGIKPQRVAALLTQLVKSGEVVKTEDKRKSFYSLA